MLFGVDMRRFGHLWTSAWRDLLFAASSPLRKLLDEPVLLYRDGEPQCFQGGLALKTPSGENPAELSARCSARLIPDDLVLTRTLTLPLAAETELSAVLAMEISASSPFAPEDTVHGCTEQGRDESTITLAIAIASRTAVSRWLRENPLAHAPGGDVEPWAHSELWAEVADDFVTITGFGETSREQAYKKRLTRCAMLSLVALALVLLAASLFALQQRAQLERMERLQSVVQQQAQSVSTMREALVSANETIRAANDVIAQYPNPHIEIARLTELMDDNVYVANFSMQGRDIRLRGRAGDAAMVMQTLAETEAFERVTAPQAITAVGNTGLEQFHLDIELVDPDASAPGNAGDDS